MRKVAPYLMLWGLLLAGLSVSAWVSLEIWALSDRLFRALLPERVFAALSEFVVIWKTWSGFFVVAAVYRGADRVRARFLPGETLLQRFVRLHGVSLPPS